MKIKVFEDLKQYTLISTLTLEDIQTLKKYQPDALKIKNADGDDVFGISYVEGKHSVSAIGITFGAASVKGNFAMVVGTIPAGTEKVEEYIADQVGAALVHINTLEESIPEALKTIKAARAELISGIEKA